MYVEDIYPTAGYASTPNGCVHLQWCRSRVPNCWVHEIFIAANVPNGCVHKIYITARVPNGCVHALLAYATILYPIKALTSVVHLRFFIVSVPKAMHAKMKSLQAYPMAHYMIYVTASMPNGCVQYWPPQLPCTHGSKLYVLNGCAPKINIIAGIPSGCVHKIHITASKPSSCVHWQ